MEDYKFLFKVVLIGNAGVGKTCLVRRFTQGLFPPGQGATIGVDFMIKTVEIDSEKIKLQIWDTAGQERFRSITQSYYRSAHALILVYDISSQPTFDCLPDWLREIEQYASCKVLRVLVGNKTDREDRELPTHVGEEFANRHNMYFIETSAKEADNVEKLFIEIAKELTQDLILDQKIWMLGQNRMMYRMDEGDNPRIIRLANQLVRSGHFDKDSKVGDLSPQDVSSITLPSPKDTKTDISCCNRLMPS